MMPRLVAGLTLALAGPGAALAATPTWCGSERLTPTEQAICADDLLSQLDLDAIEAHAAARPVGPNLSHRSWLYERERCGTDVSCLEAAYRSRISELRAVASGPGAGLGEAPRAGSVDATDAGPIGASGGVAAPEPPIPSEEPARESPDTSDAPDRPDGLQEAPRIGVGEGSEADGAVAPSDQPPGQRAEDDLLSTIAGMIPRPWCDAGRLNPTERAICADGYLSRLDALLELAYGRRTARDDDGPQISWLRSERDACGTDPACISGAYVSRIAQLGDVADRID